MTGQMKKLLAVVGVFALALLLVTGTALAHPNMPDDSIDSDKNGGRLSQMIEWMGPENWGQMIQQMNESGFCHDDEHPRYGSMMGWGSGNQMSRGFQNSGPGINDGNQGGLGYPGGMMNRGAGR